METFPDDLSKHSLILSGDLAQISDETSLLEHNLALSYEARILQHERALATYIELKKGGLQMRIRQELDDESR